MSDVVDIDDLSISLRHRRRRRRRRRGRQPARSRRGEVLAIVGESGSGKTVTARSDPRACCPRPPPTRGAVLLTQQGRRRTPRRRHAASARGCGDVRGRDAAMVFQEPSTALNPVYTVGWQIAEGLRAHGKYSKKEARAEGDRRPAPGRHPRPGAPRRPLPAPVLRRAEAAHRHRAWRWCSTPGVIIADEPTTALDVTVQAEILDLLRRCRDEFGTAIVLITHNMGVVADLADRVAVMYQGEIVEEADVRDAVLRRRRTPTRSSCSPPCRALGQGTMQHRRAGAPTARMAWADATPVVAATDLRIVYPGRLRPARTSSPSTA